MQNKIACSYYNASAISANGDLYIWGSGLSGLMGVENALTSETPKKFSLEEIHPFLKATHVSMGLNHMAIIAKNKLLDHVNPKMFLETIHKEILMKHRELFERKNWDIFSEFDVYKRVYIPRAEFLQFLDLIEAEVGYTHQEQCELLNLVDYFCLDKQGNVNIVQYIYCLDKDAFMTGIVLTVGLSENGRLGTAKDGGEESDYRGSTNTIGSEILTEEENFQARMMRKKNRIQGLRQVSFKNQVHKVCCGHKFTIALDVLGKVFVWGYGGDGCMGDGNLDDKLTPFHLKPSNFGNLQTQGVITDIAAGAEHCLVVNHYHEVYSWGKGKQGRLGHDNESSQLTPKKIEYFSQNKLRVLQIAAGEQHSAAITEDHKLYTWGSGANYRLGHGTLQTMLKPCLNIYLKDSFATKVSCGATHTLCIASTGHIYAWGSGMNGRLGIDVAGFEDHTIPARVAPLSEDFQNHNFSEICAGPHQSFGLTDEGQLFVWGSIKFKTLGLVNLKKDVYMPALLKSSFIRFHITKGQGQKKGEKIESSRNSQIDVKSNNYDLKFQKKISPNGNALRIKRIFCGETNTVFLMVNGDIYITGSGEYGQLCIDPEKKGEEFHSSKSALKEIFSEGEVLYSNTPIYLPINLETKFKHVAVGLHHIIAIDIEGKAYAWGKNTEEQLGLGHTLKYVSKATVIEQVSHKKFAMAIASHTYSALLTETGEIWVFGTAESGCLGVNPVKHNYVIGVPALIHNIPLMKHIAGGPEHMAAVSVTGDVYVWGNHNNGRLGIGGGNIRKTLLPTLVPFHERKIFTKFEQVSCGMLHTLLLDSEGCIWGAGANAYAGFPSENTYKTLEEQNAFVKIPGKVKDEKFLQIASGEFHNLALTENVEVYGWGKGDYGKLGQEILIDIDGGADSRIKNILLPRKIKKLENIKYVSSGVNHSACVDEDGEPYFWGAVQMGRLGIQKEDIKLFKKLKKIVLESNIPSLPMPQKVQIHFEEELTRKIGIFTNKTVQQLYGENLQRATSTTRDDESPSSILNLDAVRERTRETNKGVAFIKHPIISNTILSQSPFASQGLGELSVEENRRKTSELSDRKSRLMAKLSINQNGIETRPTGQGLTEKKVNTSGFNVIKNGTELSVEDYAKRMQRAQQLMKTGQMKLQREVQDEDLEFCENTLYAKDAEFTEGLRDTLQNIIEQAGELKNNFAAQIVQTQSLMQTSLSLLPQGVTMRKETVLHIPNFIAQNIQIYEGIISTLFNHPCYLHSILNNKSLDAQVTLEWIFKIYKSHDQDERVSNLILSLALMVLEDEVKVFESPFHPENGLKSVYMKLYGFLMSEQICNKKFIKEITEYLLNKIIVPLCRKTSQYILTENSGSDDGGRQDQDEKDFFDLKRYKTRVISGPEEREEFDKVLGRSIEIIQKLEEYLKDYLCQPNFSAEGKVSREISYLNHKIIDEYRQVAEHKAKTNSNTDIRLNIERVHQVEKEAKLHVIQLFFKQIPDYLMNYETHGIQVPQQYKKYLSIQNLTSIADIVTAYFSKTKISENKSFDLINEHIQVYSKKREVIASFIHGLTAHDDYEITLENILCTTEDSVKFKERYNTSLLVQDVLNIHNSLDIMITKQKILLGGSNDPLGIMFQCLGFGKISHQDFTYQMLHHPLNFKINSKILRKDSFSEQSQIHKCNYCKLIFPEHFLRMEELKMLTRNEWTCESCNTQNPFSKRQCLECERLIKQHLYQQRSIIDRYFPLVRKDAKVQGFLSFIKLHTMLFEGDDLVEILADIAQTLVKEENFERSTKYTQILSLANSLTKKIMAEDYAIDLTEAVPENQCFRVLSEMLTQEFEIRRKHKKYLERVEHLLRKLTGIVDQTKRTNKELKLKLEIIGAKVIASKGRFNGVQSKTIRTTTMVEINLYQEKLAFTGVKPFGNFTQVDLKKRKILIGFQMHNKTRAKIANNLKFYFFYHEGIGFNVKVVFVADTWKNRLVSCGNWYKNEVALDEFNIPAEHILELRRTADYKAEVTLGCSTFSVEKLAKLMDELLIKNYRYKLQGGKKRK